MALLEKFKETEEKFNSVLVNLEKILHPAAVWQECRGEFRRLHEIRREMAVLSRKLTDSCDKIGLVVEKMDAAQDKYQPPAYLDWEPKSK